MRHVWEALTWAALLQGSHDGTTWETLRTHAQDESLCKPGQFQSWPVEQGPELIFHQHFRVAMVSSGSGDVQILNVTYMEMYGYLA